MSKKSSTKKRKTHDKGLGPNIVQEKHFRQAVDLAKKCSPEWVGKTHPKVGVVVVKKGKVLATAFRGEVGKGDHAEYIALERKLRRNTEVEGADLITTLEPCTTREHDKRPCVSWIKSRRIRKVWIATLDYNPSIAGLGELTLQKDGISIGRFPDELALESITDNAEFFDLIESKQPTINQEEQSIERMLIIDILRDELDQLKRIGEIFVDPLIRGEFKKKRKRQAENLLDETNTKRNAIEKTLQYAVATEFNNAQSWIRLGHALLDIKQYGTAHSAFRIATRIDGTSDGSWDGFVKSEAMLNNKVASWPWGYPVDDVDTSPNQVKSESWLSLAQEEGRLDLKLKYVARAIQCGNRSENIWKQLQRYLGRPMTKSFEKQARISQGWFLIADVFREARFNEDKIDVCFKERHRYVTEDGKHELRYADLGGYIGEFFDDD